MILKLCDIRFKHQLAAVYVLYAVCLQTAVSISAIRRVLVQMEYVTSIMSGGVAYSYWINRREVVLEAST
jgi:hypothetical protein